MSGYGYLRAQRGTDAAGRPYQRLVIGRVWCDFYHAPPIALPSTLRAWPRRRRVVRWSAPKRSGELPRLPLQRYTRWPQGGDLTWPIADPRPVRPPSVAGRDAAGRSLRRGY